MPFEEMGVLLPRPDVYAPVFTDLLARARIPCRLHPSLPLRTGRSARALLLLFRCRGLARPAVMEFLTFAPVPWKDLLGDETLARPEQWDQLSRDAQIVSDLARWTLGLRAHAEAEREAAAVEELPPRRERRLERAADAETLLEVVNRLSGTLDGLSGMASWAEWSKHLASVFDQWVGPGPDREAVSDVLADLGGLSSISEKAAWREVEEVLEARFEWERMPLDPIAAGAVHVGVLDALAGLPFRVVAVAGLVEGGYPGVLRPDPFLLDPEREALSRGAALPEQTPTPRRDSGSRQLSLLDAMESGPQAAALALLPTTQDRLMEARRAFHGAIHQATEKLILTYPRADPRTGRERLPSLFLVAAASALLGKPAGAADLEALVHEDDGATAPLDLALHPSERDRQRVLRGGEEAAQAIAAGSPFFRQSRAASRARWHGRFSEYDGFVGELPAAIKERLDPLRAEATTSASRLATFARCGFQYLLQHVLKLEPALEPEERRRLDPLERGSLFHEVAEGFLRERRDRGELPVAEAPAMQERLLAMADEALDRFVAGSPPRFTLLWERERRLFRSTLLQWLSREAANADRSSPAYFEVGFGMPVPPGSRRATLARAARHRFAGWAYPAGDRQDRPHRPAPRRHPPPARLQDGQGAPGRRRLLPRGQAAPDPLLRAGRGPPHSRCARDRGLPRLRGRRAPGRLRSRSGHRRRVPRVPGPDARRHRQRHLRPGADLLRLLRLHRRLRAQGPHRAAALLQDGRPQPEAGPRPEGRL